MFIKGYKKWGAENQSARFLLALLFTLAASTPSLGDTQDPEEKEKLGREKLAEKLSKVSNSYAVKEARYQDGGAGNFDRNSGNPGDANTTYHSYVWDYCLQLAGSGNCQKWLDPYVSKHGMEADNDGQSPLEVKVASMWQGMKKNGDTGQGGDYGIWDIQSKGGGSVLDPDGRLDRSLLTKFELKKNVTQEVEQLGYETAQKSISITFDEDAPKNTMPNMESLRLMAGRWTRMMRNRMVTNLGELRANQKGIEFTLGEDLADCDKYLDALKQVPDEIERERIRYQGRLDPETFAADVQRRYQMCMQARNASVYMVNARVDNGEVKAGDPNQEQVDKWRSRLNIAAIDLGGIDLNSIPKPADQPLTDKDTKSEIADWNEGGTEMKAIRISNAAQIESYNEQLKSAAQGMKEAAARSPFIPDGSEEVTKYQITPGTVSLVELNGLTHEMKNELKATKAPSVKPVQSGTNPNPDRNFEDAPSQLSVTAAR